MPSLMATVVDPLVGPGASGGAAGGSRWSSTSLAWTLLAGCLLVFAVQHAAAALAGALRSLCTTIILKCEPAGYGEQETHTSPDEQPQDQHTALWQAPAAGQPGHGGGPHVALAGAGQARGTGGQQQQQMLQQQQQQQQVDVTVVVTDVQNSTLLWEGFPREMCAAIEMHDALMRRLIAAHGGVELLTEGDSFQVGLAGGSGSCCWGAEGPGRCCLAVGAAGAAAGRQALQRLVLPEEMPTEEMPGR
jgi:hypothetical protein